MSAAFLYLFHSIAYILQRLVRGSDFGVGTKISNLLMWNRVSANQCAFNVRQSNHNDQIRLLL